jgi:hypothetical protein
MSNASSKLKRNKVRFNLLFSTHAMASYAKNRLSKMFPYLPQNQFGWGKLCEGSALGII